MKIRKSGGRAKPADPFTLATEWTQPATSFNQYLNMIYGEKGVGKTSLAAELMGENGVFFAEEKGYRALRVRANDIESWKQIKVLTRQLPGPYDCVCIDIVDPIYELCMAAVCKPLGIEHPGELQDYGKTWGAVRRAFRGWIRDISGRGIGVLFLSHAEWHEITDRQGSTYHKLGPTMTGQGWKVLFPLLNNLFYYGYDGSDRILVLRGSERMDAKCQAVNNFRTPKGEPIQVIEMGESAKEAKRNLVAAFNNKLTETGVLPTVRKVVKVRKGR
jgi:hypothetical protein